MPRELWSRLTIMQLLTGIALYGVIAGVSYALRISGQLRDKEVSAERAHMLAVSARLEALRARLDPHFMFNALHTLRALVRYDPPRAERAIDELADMLRYSLRSDPGGLVTLREEWGFMAKYVEFQRLRFEDRLRVQVTMPSDAADWPVPAFCLQTLVENAVRHAVEPDPVGGTIVIETAREGDRLRIAVRDSGSGATDAKTAGSGSGLASLRERLTTL
jgi:LytS/YehU family sensor histidine kinase